MPLIELGPEDAKNTQDVDGSTGDNYTRVEMPFNSMMTEFFEASDISDLMQRMFAHTRHKLKIFECLRVVFHWIK